jgi:hypothetical protein
MNEQMRPAEVLAVEIDHFIGANGMRTLVPRLVGATARTETVKSVQTLPEPMSEDEWLLSLAEKRGQNALQGVERAINWFRENGFQVEQTKSQDALSGRDDGSLLRRPRSGVCILRRGSTVDPV